MTNFTAEQRVVIVGDETGNLGFHAPKGTLGRFVGLTPFFPNDHLVRLDNGRIVQVFACEIAAVEEEKQT